ncbi:Serine/arginine repetitive matrix protein 1 [Phytophthora pseudosyringae]|uniref:Serine/arginine repetitive matrix protein 1 n=1 Tax=Phytophthora pseudosyringae TaxID=221518 RepID=A0A8T1W3M4_9STRA|nr:Serine/arginine repetitive matrix protein 1 [Phytophthora pseudosyringae]
MAIRGTSASQDGRYYAQEKKLLAKMTFPKCFEQRVDMRKVQREVINQWVTERVTQLLGFEDDIVVAMAINLLEPKVDERLDPKALQVALTGFLEKQAGAFTEELWQLLLSAQSNPTGIPSAILDQKKQEMQRIAEDKDRLKKVLDAKRGEIEGQRKEARKKEAGRATQLEELEKKEDEAVKEGRRSPGRDHRAGVREDGRQVCGDDRGARRADADGRRVQAGARVVRADARGALHAGDRGADDLGRCL